MRWQTLALAHYSGSPIDGQLRMPDASSTGFNKPRAVWVSVDGDDDWPAWCISEEWGVESLAYRYVVKINPAARMVHLQSDAEVRAFDATFGLPGNHRSERIDWGEVQKGYDGIIIAPYQWQSRNALLWYYAWDCASGCIWNTDVIESVTLDESWVVPKRNEDAA